MKTVQIFHAHNKFKINFIKGKNGRRRKDDKISIYNYKDKLH